MMYLSGTVGKICLIADAKSVRITSAFWKEKQTQYHHETVDYSLSVSFQIKNHLILTELKFPASPVVANVYVLSLVIIEKCVGFLLSTA